jgi:hypothetical protein
MVMTSDHLCRIGWRSPPRSFVSLMTLYESNYIRLGWLLPDLRGVQGRLVSRVHRDLTLHLEVLERTPYTLLLNLTYHFTGAAGEAAIPDMHIRVYHDARLAEAQACTGAPARPAPGEPAMDAREELQRRWARNVLLNKWLEYCAGRGHLFEA